MAQQLDTRELYRALARLARRYQFRSRDEVCCYGMTVSQCYALQVLSQQESMTSTALATALGLDLSSATRLVDQLVRRKLVSRSRGAADARVKEIQITGNGTRLIARLEEEFGGLLSEAIADLPREVQLEVPGILRRLASCLECGCAAPRGTGCGEDS